jgi:hypothetical protein
MAKELPNHHILSVELLRTHNDETVAVITAVKDHMPVRFVVRGDASGQLKPGIKDHCDPHAKHGHDEHGHGEHGHGEYGHGDPNAKHAVSAMAMKLNAPDDTVTPEGMALGEPPPQQPPRPGMIGIGGALLAVAFGAAEQVPI